MYACLLVAIYRKAGLHFNITKIELVYSASWWAKSASVGYLPGVETTEVEVHLATYSLFASDH